MALRAIFDRVNYTDSNGDSRTAYFGEELIDPAEGQVERLTELGALGSDEDVEASRQAGRPTRAQQAASAGDEPADVDPTRAAQMAPSAGSPEVEGQVDGMADPSLGAEVPPAPGAEPVEQVEEGDARGAARTGRRR